MGGTLGRQGLGSSLLLLAFELSPSHVLGIYFIFIEKREEIRCEVPMSVLHTAYDDDIFTVPERGCQCPCRLRVY